MDKGNKGNMQTRRCNRKHDNWYYLDRLPAEVRLALCHAAFTWDAKWFYDHLKKGKTTSWCVVQIRDADRRKAYEDERTREGFKWRRSPSPTREHGVEPIYR